MGMTDQVLDQEPTEEKLVLHPRRMTEEEFVAWCEEDVRAEWVDGEVVMMSPVNREHAELFDWLHRLLGDFVEAADLGYVLANMFVRFAEQRRRRIPDIFFLGRERSHFLGHTHVEGPPDLVLEIVSPDSQARDWREKYLEYEAAGVCEYWIADPLSEHVEAYALRPANPAETTSQPDRYERIAEHEGRLRSTVLPGFYLRPQWLFVRPRPKVAAVLQEIAGG